jgi:hypothetical protein
VAGNRIFNRRERDTMSDHHLILGELTDCINGETLDDTLDERHRQQIGRLLMNQKGYAKTAITPRYALDFAVGDKGARILVAYMIHGADHIAMLIHYGPGSLVTRHRPALAMSRLTADYQIPVVVVTNGEQADILGGKDGAILATGLDQIPDPHDLAKICGQHEWRPVGKERQEMESRILMAYEVDDRCPCDDSTCKIR